MPPDPASAPPDEPAPEVPEPGAEFTPDASGAQAVAGSATPGREAAPAPEGRGPGEVGLSFEGRGGAGLGLEGPHPDAPDPEGPPPVGAGPEGGAGGRPDPAPAAAFAGPAIRA
ncbi:MAG: hypothetical protein Q7J13_14105, partial [Brevundimonas sp.]|nr:hypothetical protein [Brevundimonas sp.]